MVATSEDRATTELSADARAALLAEVCPRDRPGSPGASPCALADATPRRAFRCSGGAARGRHGQGHTQLHSNQVCADLAEKLGLSCCTWRPRSPIVGSRAELVAAARHERHPCRGCVLRRCRRWDRRGYSPARPWWKPGTSRRRSSWGSGAASWATCVATSSTPRTDALPGALREDRRPHTRRTAGHRLPHRHRHRRRESKGVAAVIGAASSRRWSATDLARSLLEIPDQEAE